MSSLHCAHFPSFPPPSRAIADAMKGLRPRERPKNLFSDSLLLSGLEPVRINKNTNFVNIGERCNVAGSKRFCNLVKKGKFEVLVKCVFD